MGWHGGLRTVHTTADHASCVVGSSNVVCGDSEGVLGEDSELCSTNK